MGILDSIMFNQRFNPAPPPGFQDDPSMGGLLQALQGRTMPGALPAMPTMPLGRNIATSPPPPMPSQTGVGGPAMPPMGASAPTQPQQAQAMPSPGVLGGGGGGILGGMQGFLNGPKGEALMNMLAGWAQGGTARESLGLGAHGAIGGMRSAKKKAQFARFIDNANLDPEMKALLSENPELAQQWVLGNMKGEDATDDMREYNKAVQQGFTGDFIQYQIKMKEAGRANTTVNLNDWKIPAGFMLKDQSDPNAGLKPIPGGPGEQLPAELAARTGMADTFLSQAPKIRERLSAGEATGIWDRAVGGNVQSSEQAQIIRQMKSGTDALQRMLTGAGMPAAEAQQYAERYLPTYTDNAASASQKLDQLVKELTTINDKVMRGRGGATQLSGDGVIDYQDWLQQ